MTRTKSTFFALIAVLLSPIAANAEIITYDIAADSGSGWSFEGSITFDVADLAAGGDIGAYLTSFYFEWTDGVDVYTNDSSAGDTMDYLVFVILAGGDFSSADWCSNACDPGHAFDHTFFAIAGDSPAWGWVAVIGSADNPFCCAEDFGFGNVVTTRGVPEPGTLALLGAGLFGMAAARRRRKV